MSSTLVKRLGIFALLVVFVLAMTACEPTVKYTLTLAIEGEGTVTDYEAGEYEFAENAVVDLAVVPDEGFEFAGWAGDDGDDVVWDEDEEVWKITMDADKSITAVFEEEEPVEPDTFTVTFDVNVEDAVVTFDGVEFDPGVYVVEDVEPGEYDYSVAKEGYVTVEDTVEVVDEDVTVTVVLEEEVDEELEAAIALVEAAEAAVEVLDTQTQIDAAQVAFDEAVAAVEALPESPEKTELEERLEDVLAAIVEAQEALEDTYEKVTAQKVMDRLQEVNEDVDFEEVVEDFNLPKNILLGEEELFEFTWTAEENDFVDIDGFVAHVTRPEFGEEDAEVTLAALLSFLGILEEEEEDPRVVEVQVTIKAELSEAEYAVMAYEAVDEDEIDSFVEYEAVEELRETAQDLVDELDEGDLQDALQVRIDVKEGEIEAALAKYVTAVMDAATAGNQIDLLEALEDFFKNVNEDYIVAYKDALLAEAPADVEGIQEVIDTVNLEQTVVADINAAVASGNQLTLKAALQKHQDHFERINFASTHIAEYMDVLTDAEDSVAVIQDAIDVANHNLAVVAVDEAVATVDRAKWNYAQELVAALDDVTQETEKEDLQDALDDHDLIIKVSEATTGEELLAALEDLVDNHTDGANLDLEVVFEVLLDAYMEAIADEDGENKNTVDKIEGIIIDVNDNTLDPDSVEIDTPETGDSFTETDGFILTISANNYSGDPFVGTAKNGVITFFNYDEDIEESIGSGDEGIPFVDGSFTITVHNTTSDAEYISLAEDLELFEDVTEINEITVTIDGGTATVKNLNPYEITFIVTVAEAEVGALEGPDPIQDAKVTILDADEEEIDAGNTDDNGVVTLKAVFGTYTYKVTHPEYVTYVDTLEVTEDDDVDVAMSWLSIEESTITITPDKDEYVAGEEIQITLTLKDQDGTVITEIDEQYAAKISVEGRNYNRTLTFNEGVATTTIKLYNVKLDAEEEEYVAQDITITVEDLYDDNRIFTETEALTVVSAPAAELEIEATATGKELTEVTITVVDEFGNTVLGYTGWKDAVVSLEFKADVTESRPVDLDGAVSLKFEFGVFEGAIDLTEILEEDLGSEDVIKIEIPADNLEGLFEVPIGD